MGRPTRRKLLFAVLVAQVAVLLGITALHGARVADGTRVLLAVVPVDPLDLARGAYVDLRYELEELPLPDDVGEGDDVFVELRRPDGGDETWSAVTVASSPDAFEDPDAYIKLSVQDRSIDTGRIGTYYASADVAQRLERDLADGGVAEVVLSSDGEPLLDEVRG